MLVRLVRLIAVLGVAMACLSASADYLYWQVDTTSSDTGQALAAALESAGAGGVDDLVGARLVQVDTADNSTSTLGAVGASGFNTRQSAELPAIDFATLGTRYSYYIEYVSAAFTPSRVAVVSENLTYEELATKNAIYTGSEMDVPNLSAWSGTSFTAVAPEPTAGMLLLLGLAAMALRRGWSDGRDG